MMNTATIGKEPHSYYENFCMSSCTCMSIKKFIRGPISEHSKDTKQL